MKILFPHCKLIASTEALEFHQGEAAKRREPVIVPEYPWEGVSTYLYGSVVKTTLYRMWYQANGVYVAYARSRDGIIWQKPLDNRFDMADRPAGLTVALDGGGGEACAPPGGAVAPQSNIVFELHMPSVIHDPGDRRRPYKLFGYSDQGYCAAFSRNGLHFTPAKKNPVIPLMKYPAPGGRKSWFSDVAPAFKDTRRGKFVSHVKTYQCDSEGRIRRCVGYAESADFLRWSKPTTIWVPGESEDRLARAKGFRWADFYGLCAFNYGDGYLGLLWLFYIDYEIPRGTHEGKIEVFLASSRDGKKWRRFSDQPLIPLSPSGWDRGMITTTGQPLFTKDDVRIYYGGANMSHGAGEADNPYDERVHRFKIGLATLRQDGFVYASSAKGRLTTKPMKSVKGQIKVNADCRGGKILIEVFQRRRKAKSFELAGGDFLNRILRTAMRGSIVLKIAIENAKLYSVEVA